MKHVLIPVLAAAGILSSCGFSAEKCVKADWHAIGRADGERGTSLDRLQHHVKSCTKHDVVIDMDAWNVGHAEGLKTYCTAQSAYRLGRSGRNLKSVCPDAEVSELRAANEKGQLYYDISSKIDDLERERADLRAEIRLALKTPTANTNIGWLRLKISQIDLRISGLERKRQQYGQL
jgi:hypothetical protein